MKNKNLKINLLLSGGLLLLYTATFLISLVSSSPIEWLDFIATASVTLGTAVLLERMPTPYYSAIVLFAFVAQYFGMMFGWYHTIWWYDLLVHFLSGFILGAIGQFLSSLIYRKADQKAPIAMTSLFAIFFSIACAGLWEIYEYCADTFFGLNSQTGMGQTAIHDTMQDIIAGSVSAVLYGGGLALYLYRKKYK